MRSLHAFAFLLAVSATACTVEPPDVSRAEQAIVGGTELPFPVPFVVSVHVRGRSGNEGHWCGGTLIAPQWVLTAAQCTVYDDGTPPPPPSVLYVVYGESDLSEVDPAHKIELAEIVRHPDFDILTSFDHNVALLKLAKPVPHAVPLAYDNRGLLAHPNAGFAFGWGGHDVVELPRNEPSDTVANWLPSDLGGSDVLRAAWLETIDGATCNQRYVDGLNANGWETPADAQVISTDAVCTKRGDAAVDTCDHDLGGPLVVFDPHRLRFVVAGITQAYYGCGDAEFPGVTTRVADYADFIRATLAR